MIIISGRFQADNPTFCQAAEVVRAVIDHGKLRPPDILSQLGISEPKSEHI